MSEKIRYIVHKPRVNFSFSATKVTTTYYIIRMLTLPKVSKFS